MNPRTEERFKRVQDAAKSSLSRRMYEREQKIISRIVMEYRSDTITSEKLFGAVAAISELRSIVTEVDQDLMQASDDSLKFSQQGN